MTTKLKKNKKSKAMKYLDELTGGPLNLPELLSAIRIGEGLSCAELSTKLGISRSHLCDIEKGRKAVSLLRAIQFADLLGYSKDQFARLALQMQLDEAGLRYKVKIEAA